MDCITQQTSSQHCNQTTVEGFWVVEQQSLYLTQCIIIIKHVKDFGASIHINAERFVLSERIILSVCLT